MQEVGQGQIVTVAWFVHGEGVAGSNVTSDGPSPLRGTFFQNKVSRPIPCF